MTRTPPESEETRATRSWTAQLLPTVLFLLLGWGLLHFFVTIVEPQERKPQVPFSADYSENPLLDVLALNRFDANMDALADAGQPRDGEHSIGRLSGSPGFHRTEALILDIFARAGLNIHTQALQVVVPVTEVCEILDETGRPLEDVRLYPVFPAGLLPIALPPEGITANLLATHDLGTGNLNGHAPTNTIILSYPGDGNGWPDLASLGVRALIIDDDELEKSFRADADHRGNWWSAQQVTSEATFPRFYARGPLRQHAGRTVRIRCTVTWQERTVQNIVGVLPGRESNREALILSAPYDGISVIPDISPAAEAALSLATLLELVEALEPYRGTLKRDVVFVATAGHAQARAGVCRLMEAMDQLTPSEADYRSLEEQMADEESGRTRAAQAHALLERLPSDRAKRSAYLTAHNKGQDTASRKWLQAQLQVALGEINLGFRDATLEARLAYIRAGQPAYRDGFDPLTATEAERKDPAQQHPLLTAYLDHKRFDDRSANFMASLLAEGITRPEFDAWNVRAKMLEHLAQIVVHHQQRSTQIRQTIALRDTLARYQNTLTLNLRLYSGGHQSRRDLALLLGEAGIGTIVLPQVAELANAITDKIPNIDGTPLFSVTHWGAADATGKAQSLNPHGSNPPFESRLWHTFGRQAFTLVNRHFVPPRLGTPEDDFKELNRDVVRGMRPTLGRAILSVAQGRVPFKSFESTRTGKIQTLRGAVFGQAGSASLIPSHPSTRRTFVRAYSGATPAADHIVTDKGTSRYPILQTDPYGRYDRRFLTGYSPWSVFTVDAVRFDSTGRVSYFKDNSPAGQSVLKSTGLSPKHFLAGRGKPVKPVNIPIFRATPIAIYNRINPQTLRNFQRVNFIDTVGLTTPKAIHQGTMLTMLEPDTRFYVTMMAGAPGNEEILDVRAFMLNVDPATVPNPEEPEIHGRGYLAADTPVLLRPFREAARSMTRTAQKRLALQSRFHMADEQSMDFQERSQTWLDIAAENDAASDAQAAVNASATSLAYAINNHPVIQNRIKHAVYGILWYLALLVPFVIFFEKLVFGFTDIRKQLMMNGIIFLAFFSILRFFHPAFQIVRSSLMILLGFIIFLLTLLVTLMVSSKFKQNLKELRSKEGRVEGADVNRGGLIGVALMLGLNNMRRRKVRTGLTCLTLIFITFAMICFTSISSNLVNTEYITGRSAWNGITIQKEGFLPLDPTEITNLRRLYADRLPMAQTVWITGALNAWHVQRVGLQNAELPVERVFDVGETRVSKRSIADGGLILDWSEPLFSGIDDMLLTRKDWFPRPPATQREKITAAAEGYQARNLIVLPDQMAAALDISVEDVNAGSVTVTIGSTEFFVCGIIDSAQLGRIQGLDGKPILPIDLNSIQALGRKNQWAVIPEDTQRIDPARVVLVNKSPAGVANIEQRTVSLSLLFPDKPCRVATDQPEQAPLGVKAQRQIVLEHLERTGEAAYYAIDGLAYYGVRKRARSIGGLLQLLVPLLLAALTVFNTMRGSVYERKDEIYVYNAVGIAPNHVFFMFMAEAGVYAVIGAMMGYILSQGTGRLLTALGLTGGLNLDYSSIETIYASIAIIGAVLLSTVIPARDAARVASPSGVASWALPEISGDVMTFNLPFTFTPHDRLAVVSYFSRWLDAHGEGSSGPFYCAPPEASLETDEHIPVVASTVWLKPYDLGVSQRMEISLPTDPETDEFIAHVRLTRLSGNIVGWQRTVKPFLGVVRKQFLNWRATTDGERSEMFEEAREIIKGATL
jgi:hypothetical protein